jgi:protein-S-isoprenylcysteine O-methyltransferase Ste14
MPVKSVFKWRGWLAAAPVIVAFWCFRWEFDNDTVAWAVGGAVFLAAVALRVSAQCHLGYRLRVHKILTVTGPYRYSRNPIYIANIAMIAAMVWLMELPWLVAPTVIWCAMVYSAVVRYEEKRLLANFGEAYRRYTESVPRWFGWHGMQSVPRWFGWHGMQGDDGVRVRRYLAAACRSEVHCLLFLLLPAVKELLG